jgi:hypothetical protein
MTIFQPERQLGRAERVALCAMRRAVRGEAGGSDAIVCPFGLGRDQARVRALFLAVWDGSAALCHQALPLRGPGGWGVTKMERRLLRALAAAQAENVWLLDNYLYKIALEPGIRHRLMEAVEALAATLAVHGYWLAHPVDMLPVPASALRVARTHGRDLEMASIAWPQ